MTIHIVLLVLALVCFLASAAGVRSQANLQSCGLALWVLSLLLP